MMIIESIPCLGTPLIAPSKCNLIHALTTSPVVATRLEKTRTRPISLYWPPTKAWECSNPTLDPTFTIAATFYGLSTTRLATTTHGNNDNQEETHALKYCIWMQQTR